MKQDKCMRTIRNRHLIGLVMILSSAISNIVLGNAAVWQVTWLVFALAAFSETYVALCYIEEAVRDKPRDRDGDAI